MELREAVIRAGALRTRLIVLTATTVMFASGVLVSTVETLVLIPLLFYHWCHRELEE